MRCRTSGGTAFGPRPARIDQEPLPGVFDSGLVDDPVVTLSSRVRVIGRAAPDANGLLERVYVLAQELNALRAAIWYVAGSVVELDVHFGAKDVLPLELDEVVEQFCRTLRLRRRLRLMALLGSERFV